MAVEQQHWKFSISAEIINGDDKLTIYPENITNLIINYDYHNRIMPTILARVNLDKNLLDLIIQKAENLEIELSIKKFTQAIDDPLTKGPEVEFIKGTYLVSVGSDINYNKELDYAENTITDIPAEDKFAQTYLGLASKANIDANKVVANEVVHQTFHQDLVLSYLLQNCHLLIEPFDHNNMHNNLVIPPLDTMSSLMEYLNSVQVFYNTKYILFFDEPRVTYLISRSGKAIKMKGEEHSIVMLNMRSTTEENNLTVGMNDDQDVGAYTLDVSVLDSNYNIDKDTGKMIDSIDAIINPTLELSTISGDMLKNLKSQLQTVMQDFLKKALQQALSSLNIGTKLSSIINQLKHASDAIQKVSINLQKRANETVNQFASTAVKAVGTNIQEECNKILEQLPTAMTTTVGGNTITKPIITEAQKVLEKSKLDSRFMSADVARSNQKVIKSAFSEAIENGTMAEEYKKDFISNNISAVTYINLQDVTGETISNIVSLQDGIKAAQENMQTNVNSKVGNYDNFIQSNSELLNQVQDWKKLVMQSMTSTTSSSNGASNSAASSQLGLLLKNIIAQESNLTTIVGESIKYTNIIKSNIADANAANANLAKSASVFNSFKTILSDAGSKDVKSIFVKKVPTRIFGSNSLSLEQILTTVPNCWGSNENNGIANTWSQLGASLGGTLNFSDLTKLADNLFKFNLSKIGSLGLSHFNFNLNLGKIAQDLIGSIIGTKILRTKNDNPNMLKNIKSEIELSKNQLSVNKFGIDPDVFTPNKEYVIKNYEAHSNKDGKFVLNKKVVVFSREGQDFSANTQLFFSKAIEESNTTDAQDVNISQ